jgi:hypothetical protein
MYRFVAKITYAVLILLLFNSCKVKTNEQIPSVSLTDISGNVKIADVFDEFEYIALETSEESIFGTVNKLIIHDNKFFILDKFKMNKIFVFHDDGTFSHTVGSEGGGPGEYRNVEDFIIDKEKNRVIILCYPSLAYIYDMNGKFIETKKISSSVMFWSICNYSNGYICSTNHQTATEGENARLAFIFDKDFNLKYKLFDVLPVQVSFPTFVSPLYSDDDEIIYFDGFTSSIHFININNPADTRSIKFILENEATAELYENKDGKFVKYQQDYCFFINGFYADNTVWSSVANKGKEFIFIMNFKTGKKIVSWASDGWFSINFYQNDYFYSSINPVRILEGHELFSAKQINTLLIEYDSNPAIVRFKSKEIFK